MTYPTSRTLQQGGTTLRLNGMASSENKSDANDLAVCPTRAKWQLRATSQPDTPDTALSSQGNEAREQGEGRLSLARCIPADSAGDPVQSKTHAHKSGLAGAASSGLLTLAARQRGFCANF